MLLHLLVNLFTASHKFYSIRLSTSVNSTVATKHLHNDSVLKSWKKNHSEWKESLWRIQGSKGVLCTQACCCCIRADAHYLPIIYCYIGPCLYTPPECIEKTGLLESWHRISTILIEFYTPSIFKVVLQKCTMMQPLSS